MDKDERERLRKRPRYFGEREFFRFMGFFSGWILLGILIDMFLVEALHVKEDIGIVVFMLFLTTAFAFPMVALFWKPANSLLNTFFRNKNYDIPTIPLSRIGLKQHPWYYYLPSLWGWLLLLVLLYFVLKSLAK